VWRIFIQRFFPSQRCHSFGQIFFAALLALVLILPARAQQAAPSQLDSLASEAAAAIHKKTKLPFDMSHVLVADFVETQGRPSELGGELAREFSDSLSKHAIQFNVLDREEYLKKYSADKLSPDSYGKPETTRCYAMEFDAMAVVTGSLDVLSDKVVLRVYAMRVADKEVIFDQRISLPLTSEMQMLISEPARALWDSSRSSAHATGSGGQSPPNDGLHSDIPPGGTKGYTMPTCTYCPAAKFSEVASNAKFQGLVTLQVEIGADGIATKVSVIRGLPCGLNQSALDAIYKWRFKPANGPDGMPAAVTVPVEVQFHLY